MKTVLSIITILLLSSVLSFAQKWQYGLGDNDFDGSFKYAYVAGSGGSFPYNESELFVNHINNKINVYVEGAGYSTCSNKLILIKFSDDDIVYKSSVYTNCGPQD